MAQVLFFDIFSKKDPHLNPVECMIFQSIIILLINLTYQKFINFDD